MIRIVTFHLGVRGDINCNTNGVVVQNATKMLSCRLLIGTGGVAVVLTVLNNIFVKKMYLYSKFRSINKKKKIFTKLYNVVCFIQHGNFNHVDIATHDTIYEV